MVKLPPHCLQLGSFADERDAGTEQGGRRCFGRFESVGRPSGSGHGA